MPDPERGQPTMTIVPQPPPTVDLSDVIEAIEAMGRANNEAMQGFGEQLASKEREKRERREMRGLAAGKYPVKPKVVKKTFLKKNSRKSLASSLDKKKRKKIPA